MTTFREDHQYADHRRPDGVTFTDSIGADLARRDFTVNAIAWGRAAGAMSEEWVDPTDGLADLRAMFLRAVGDPAKRFDEDGLRLLRAARLSAQLGFDIEPATLAAMSATAETVRWVSSERVGAELKRMVATPRPSDAFRILSTTGVLEHCLPELAAQRGVAQDKIPGHDLWEHCLTALDAAVGIDPENRPCTWPRCCTTSASPEPPPTATSSATMRRAPGWRASCWRASPFRTAMSSTWRR